MVFVLSKFGPKVAPQNLIGLEAFPNIVTSIDRELHFLQPARVGVSTQRLLY
jgi:hypothetical protein